MKTIHYEDDGQGFPIVWVHGFPLSSAMFAPQVALRGYRHIRPDLRGFGKTPAPDSAASMESYASDVLAAMDAVGVERAVIAGFSMGGYVVMQMLRVAPERFAALLLIDTRETPDSEEARANRLRQIDDVKKNGTRNVIDSMLPKMVLTAAVQAAVRPIMESASPAGVVAALEAMAARGDSTGVLRGVHVPALVVVGDRDEITPPTDAERMVALMPNAEMAPIAKAAHMASYERPEQLNPILAAFLMRHVTRHDYEHEHAPSV